VLFLPQFFDCFWYFYFKFLQVRFVDIYWFIRVASFAI
jgi:hypothetical protein